MPEHAAGAPLLIAGARIVSGGAVVENGWVRFEQGRVVAEGRPADLSPDSGTGGGTSDRQRDGAERDRV